MPLNLLFATIIFSYFAITSCNSSSFEGSTSVAKEQKTQKPKSSDDAVKEDKDEENLDDETHGEDIVIDSPDNDGDVDVDADAETEAETSTEEEIDFGFDADTTAEDLKIVCDDARADASLLKVKKTSLTYPERKDCSWNKNENLGPKNGFVQAYETSSNFVTIPKGAVICGFEIKSSMDQVTKQAQNIHYDDFLFLLLDDNVIFSSNSSVSNFLSSKTAGGAKQFDFTKVRGKQLVSFESGAYCLEGATCVIPGHDKRGPIDLSLASEASSQIALSSLGKDKIDINFVAIGDNDPEDCFHSDIALDVTLEYVTN